MIASTITLFGLAVHEIFNKQCELTKHQNGFVSHCSVLAELMSVPSNIENMTIGIHIKVLYECTYYSSFY